MREFDKSYSGRFLGKQILIVEDGYFLSDEARQKLTGLGARILGPVGSVAKALALLGDGAADAAILDTHFDGDLAFAIAERLEELGLPYVFATGSHAYVSAQVFPGFVLSERATDLEHIARALFGPSQKDT